jgi:hypothetical protein
MVIMMPFFSYDGSRRFFIFFYTCMLSLAVLGLLLAYIERPEWLYFVSMFTHQSTFLLVLFCLVKLISKETNNITWQLYLEGFATQGMLATGLIYHVFLAHPGLSLNSILLHYLLPGLVLAQFLWHSHLHRLSAKSMLIFLIHPLLFLGWTYLRFLADHFYPYAFLNFQYADQSRFWITIALLLAIFILLAQSLRWIKYWQNR